MSILSVFGVRCSRSHCQLIDKLNSDHDKPTKNKSNVECVDSRKVSRIGIFVSTVLTGQTAQKYSLINTRVAKIWREKKTDGKRKSKNLFLVCFTSYDFAVPSHTRNIATNENESTFQYAKYRKSIQFLFQRLNSWIEKKNCEQQNHRPLFLSFRIRLYDFQFFN